MKSQPWRHGVLRRCLPAALALGFANGEANAACPPGVDDGTVVARDELVLAYRPVVNAEHTVNASRIPMARHFALELQLCDRGGVSAGLLKKADATMPEHRHGMNYRPVIKPLGAGRFRVEGMMFHMAGRWQLAFEVQGGKETVRLTHDVQVE